MLDRCTLFFCLSNLYDPHFVIIADGRTYHIKGQDISDPTSQLPLINVLYVLNFFINLLSVSVNT